MYSLQDRPAPTVSVLMCVCNGARYLHAALDSVLLQRFDDFELIVVDDASSDGTAFILSSYSDPRLKVHHSPRAIGLVAARNRALALARGRFCAILDSDDVWHPDRLALQVEWMAAHPECDLVGSRCCLIDERGSGCQGWAIDRKTTSQESIAAMMPYRPVMAHSSVLIRTALLKRLRYRTPDSIREDYDLWLRMLSAGHRINKLPQQLVGQRISSGAFRSDTASRPEELSLLRSKRHFLRERLSERQWGLFEQRVLFGAFRDLCVVTAKAGLRLFLGAWPAADRDDRALQIHRHPVIRAVIGMTAGIARLIPWNLQGPLLIIPFHHLGGAEQVHLRIVESIADTHPTVLFTKRSNGPSWLSRFRETGARCLDLWWFCRLWYPVSVGIVAGMINRQQQPVVFGSNSLFYALLIPFLKPHVTVIDLTHAFGGPAERFMLPVAERLDLRVAISKTVARQLARQYEQAGLDPQLAKRIVVIGNAVDLPYQSHTRTSERLLRLIYVGRPDDEKRVHLIGRAFQQVRQAGVPVALVMVGEGLEQAVYPEDRAGITFSGAVVDHEEVLPLYRQADAVVISSSREGFPLTLMEGMVNGCIPIATEVGAIPEYLIHRQNSWLVPSDDEAAVVAGLAEAFTTLAGDRDLRRWLAEEAERVGRERFAPADFRTAYRRLFGRNDD